MPRAKRERILRHLILCVLLLLLGLGGYRAFAWNPKYDLQRVQGLTPDEVIARLGQPDFDPRKQGWNEKEWGPLQFDYNEFFGKGYLLTFENNHVVRVNRGRK